MIWLMTLTMSYKKMEGVRSSITKEELQELEAETLSLPVLVLSHESSVEEITEVCDRLREGNKVLGFDTETKPSFYKGNYFKVSLIQISSPEIVVLIRLLPKMGRKQLAPIEKILKSKRIAKVGVGIADDAKGLWKDHKLVTNRMLELRSLSKVAGLEVQSLAKLYAVLYGKRLSKRQRLSDWERTMLSNAQVEYAALDAVAGLRIYEALQKYLKREMYFHLDVAPTPQRGVKGRNKCVKKDEATTAKGGA